MPSPGGSWTGNPNRGPRSAAQRPPGEGIPVPSSSRLLSPEGLYGFGDRELALVEGATDDGAFDVGGALAG